MIGKPAMEPMSGHLRYGKLIYRATRFSNPNWCWRGDNTKPKAKK